MVSIFALLLSLFLSVLEPLLFTAQSLFTKFAEWKAHLGLICWWKVCLYAQQYHLETMNYTYNFWENKVIMQDVWVARLKSVITAQGYPAPCPCTNCPNQIQLFDWLIKGAWLLNTEHLFEKVGSLYSHTRTYTGIREYYIVSCQCGYCHNLVRLAQLPIANVFQDD